MAPASNARSTTLLTVRSCVVQSTSTTASTQYLKSELSISGSLSACALSLYTDKVKSSLSNRRTHALICDNIVSIINSLVGAATGPTWSVVQALVRLTPGPGAANGCKQDGVLLAKRQLGFYLSSTQHLLPISKSQHLQAM